MKYIKLGIFFLLVLSSIVIGTNSILQKNASLVPLSLFLTILILLIAIYVTKLKS